MQPILLPMFRPPRSVWAAADDQLARALGRTMVMRIDGKDYEVDPALLSQAESYRTLAICEAVVEACVQWTLERNSFTPHGLDQAFHDNLHFNGDALYKLKVQQQSQAHEDQVERALEGGLLQQGTDLTRHMTMLAQAGGVRDLFFTTSEDWRSSYRIELSLREITVKARNPILRQRMNMMGITDAMLLDATKLCEALHKAREEARKDVAEDGQLRTLLRYGRMLCLGDITMLSVTARAVLSPDRWEPFQLNRLLNLPRRTREQAPADPEADPAPVPPRPAQPAGPSAGPAPGGPGTGPTPGQPAPGQPAPGWPTPAPATGGTGPAGPDRIQPSPDAPRPPMPQPQPQPQPVIQPGTTPLRAGMILRVMQGLNGVWMAEVVQPDLSLSWVPMEQPPGQPQPVPVREPAPRAGTEKEKPKPKTTTRSGRR